LGLSISLVASHLFADTPKRDLLASEDDFSFLSLELTILDVARNLDPIFFLQVFANLPFLESCLVLRFATIVVSRYSRESGFCDVCSTDLAENPWSRAMISMTPPGAVNGLSSVT
jgi:hypothetical protein